MRVGDLDETALLARVIPRLPTQALLGPGDDAAVVAAPDGRVVATTDMLVEFRDFRRDWSTGADVGWKAAAQNLADVAAMGATCTGLLVSLGLPPTLDVSWVDSFATGLGEACRHFGAVVVGGDLSGASEIVVAVTALGDLAGRSPLRRSGACPGDVVAVAGVLGGSAAGLDLLRENRFDGPSDLLAAHRRPRPPLAAGPVAALAGASALMDVSDGLLRDGARIAVASGVSLALRTDATVLGSWAAALAVATGASAVTAQGWVLTGGEDHALLGCFPPELELPAAFAAIGTVRASGRDAVTVDGTRWAGPGVGWDHFG
ncbi:MAG: thiamine-phosphate kinase [Janthinobacterium lividum]